MISKYQEIFISLLCFDSLPMNLCDMIFIPYATCLENIKNLMHIVWRNLGREKCQEGRDRTFWSQLFEVIWLLLCLQNCYFFISFMYLQYFTLYQVRIMILQIAYRPWILQSYIIFDEFDHFARPWQSLKITFYSDFLICDIPPFSNFWVVSLLFS